MRAVRTLFLAFVSALLCAGCTAMQTTHAATTVTYQDKNYYAVKADNPAMNTGNKVCAMHEQTCVGYTSLDTTAVCELFHPTAKILVSGDGSKAGFYCDGALRTGPACDSLSNTCEVCPGCNVNMNCATDLTALNLVREAYVECDGASSSAARATAAASSAAFLVPKLVRVAP